MGQNIVVERYDEGYAVVTLNRPEKLNTLSIALRREFADAVADLESDPQTRVLILTAAGHIFTAGLDLDEWSASPEIVAANAYVDDAVAALLRFNGPVIGAINGACITGGLEMALACDVLIASQHAKFADTHAKVGLLPGWGGSVRLIQRVGIARAKEMALTGRFVTADQALSWGLINCVVEPARLLDEAGEWALRMLDCDHPTLVDYRNLLNQEAGTTYSDALGIERGASMNHNSGVPHEFIDTRLAAISKGRA